MTTSTPNKPGTQISVEDQLLHNVTEAQTAVTAAEGKDAKAQAVASYNAAVSTLAAYYAERQAADMVHDAKRIVRTSTITLSPIIEAWADTQAALYAQHGSLTYREAPPMLKATAQMGSWNSDHAATLKVALSAAFKRHNVTVAKSNTTARIGDVLITIAMTRGKGEPEPIPTVRVRTAI